jgi:hypothetical protein
MMMIPEAWQDNDNLSDTKKAFYEYNSCVMEPWDGPAMVAFTDGRYIGATLDRNGLRPSRYYVTKDDHVIVSSEIGVCNDLPDMDVVVKHRLEPGKMFLVDFESQKIIPDNEIKEQIASQRPYGEWVEKGLISLKKWAENSGVTRPPMDFNLTNRKLNLFGYSSEKLDMLLLPMAVGGKEPLGSMGNDAALAVLSEKPRQVNDYFKQLFAQVTNPPIDPIREEIVMSLVCPVGPEGNLLAEPGPEHCRRLNVTHPVLSLEEMETLKNGSKDFKCAVIDITFPVGSGPDGLLAVSLLDDPKKPSQYLWLTCRFSIRPWNEFATKLPTQFKDLHMVSLVCKVSSCLINSLVQIVSPSLPSWLSELSITT